MNWILVVALFIAGCAVSFQAGVNGALGKKIGIIEAALTSFTIGTIILSIVMLFYRRGNITQVLEVPKWQLAGGLLGAFYVFVMVVSVPRLGIASSLITLLLGQLVCSTIIDHFGIIHGHPIPVSFNRIAGLVLMIAAMYLFFKK